MIIFNILIFITDKNKFIMVRIIDILKQTFRFIGSQCTLIKYDHHTVTLLHHCTCESIKRRRHIDNHAVVESGRNQLVK